MYAIVRSGGRQHKVAVGDVFETNRVSAVPGSSVRLPAVLVVDGDTVTSDPVALAEVTVSAQVVADTKGPKIRILKFKNKTGYRKRQGHRQPLSELRITGIDGGAAPAATGPADTPTPEVAGAASPGLTAATTAAITETTATGATAADSEE